jgi:uncharacterized protein
VSPDPRTEPFLAEYAAVLAGGVLVAARLLQERQWLPLAALGVVAATYPFARPSVRALLAFVLAPLAFVGAALAVLDADWNGFTPAQLTAFALAPAGAALLAAVVLALRRRPSPVGRTRRIGRWVLTVVTGVLLLYYGVVAVGAALWITGKPRVPVRTFSVPHRDVALTSSDGTRLAAWYVPPRNGAAVVLVHGGGGSRDGLKLHAAMLARHGYGVLLYDERGRGGSGGRSDAFGWDWPSDVEAAVTYLENQGVHEVGVLGLSTGAEVALTAAADDPRIDAVVADGAEARTLDDFEHQRGLDRWTSVPYWAVTSFAVHVIRRTQVAPPLDHVMRRITPRPLLLVQSNDPAERELAPVWARIDGRPGVLWHVDAAHTKGLATHPAAYRRHVLGLFDRALVAPARIG